MQPEETLSRYPFLISVRRSRPVPARKEGYYYVCAYEVFLGLWWPPREVTVLEHDPHRDFYREQIEARDAVDRSAAPDAGRAASNGSPTATPGLGGDAPAWERVDSPVLRPPAPSTARSAPYAPRRAWGR